VFEVYRVFALFTVGELPAFVLCLLTSEGGGIEATRAIRHQCPKTQVLILTVFADPGLFRSVATAGASGYVLKDISPTNLTNAIRAVHSGRTMISPVMARHMMEGLFNGNGETTGGRLQGFVSCRFLLSAETAAENALAGG
jgi:DNA-binding NarL/FixJ family response regulator